MNHVFAPLFVVTLMMATSLSVIADDEADARAIIDKALKAIGGEEKALKMKAAVWKAKVIMTFSHGSIKYTGTGTWYVDLPQRCRLATETEGRPLFTFVMNGNRAWSAGVGEKTTECVNESPGPELLYAYWVEGLTPLRDRSFRLSLLADTRVNDRPVSGVKVVRKDKPNVHLYFDKENGQLAQTQLLIDKHLLYEAVYSEYKESNGFKHPTQVKVLLSSPESIFGEMEMVYTITEYRRFEKLDDKLFEKPDPVEKK